MRRFLSLLLILALLLTGCAAAPETQAPSAPQKVAVLFSSLAELWQLAGGEVTITVGESIERGFCPADTLLVDNGAGKTIDTERLLTYQPDLVLGSADIEAHQEAAALLEEAGIPCTLLQIDSFTDYLEALRLCTDLIGDREAYQKNGLAIKEQIEAIQEKAGEREPQKVLFIRSGSKASSAKAKTADQHFAAAMLEELGAYNIADNAPLLLDGLSLEEILREDPAHIFISTMGDETAAKTYMESVLFQPAWQALTAVKNGAVTYLPKELFQYKPNARWAEAYKVLYNALYQE